MSAMMGSCHFTKEVYVGIFCNCIVHIDYCKIRDVIPSNLADVTCSSDPWKMKPVCSLYATDRCSAVETIMAA